MAVGRTCGGERLEDGLSVGHLQGSQVRLDAVLPPDAVVQDLDVQLAHPAQDGLRQHRSDTFTPARHGRLAKPKARGESRATYTRLRDDERNAR